jgi:hypothetical protein
MNPLTFYYSSRTSTNTNWDWYSPTVITDTEGAIRRDLWSGIYKTDFDPCPDGWSLSKLSIFDYVPYIKFENNKGVLLYDVNGNIVGNFVPAGYVIGNGSSPTLYSNGTRISFRINANSICDISQTAINAEARLYSINAGNVRCVKIQ